jgi:protein SCO1/2
MRTLFWARVAAWLLAVIASVVVVVLATGVFERETGGTGTTSSVGSVGGPFTLIGTDGQTVTDADFAGRPRAMFFGFTHCPDVCPTTLAEAEGWLKALGPAGDDLSIVFVSVDPERDTPELMKSYLSAFDPRIVGLTGTPEQIAAVTKAYRVYARKVELEGGDYTMDHSAAVLLFDRNGAFAGTVDYRDPQDKAVDKLKTVVGS